MYFYNFQMLQVKDIFLTPIYLIFVYLIALGFRPKVTNDLDRGYYLSALTFKVIGSVLMGLVYTFYYKAGDTTSYFFHSRVITEALIENPPLGIELLFSDGKIVPQLLLYTHRMFWYQAPAEFFVARVAGVINLLTFSTYMPTAMFFALLSFSGMWAMFRTFLKLFPELHRQFAIALFFLPSVFFWGSGLMKDSLCLGGLGWMLFAAHRLLIERKKILYSIAILIAAAYPVLVMKAYIVLAFAPPALFWVINEAGSRIKNKVTRRVLGPIFVTAGIGAALIGLTSLTKGDNRFDLDKVAERAKITSDYIYRVSIQEGGAAYNLGEMDGTMAGMIKLAPQAINVALFRPYLWEVRNPIMLLSSLESAIFLYLTISLILQTGLIRSVMLISSAPILQMCFTFAIIFSFAVGISTNNFGTLARYKVQMMPFFLSGLYIARHLARRQTILRKKAFAMS
jgi:hypothetical protein